MKCCVAYLSLIVFIASTVVATEDGLLTVKSLDNSDIKWDGSFIGLSPRMSARSKKVLNEVAAKDVDALMAMLKDKDRFVVAHVILAEIHETETEIRADSFFGLKVDLYADGKVVYPDYKPDVLSRYWAKMHQDSKLDLPSARPVSEKK